MNDITQLYQRFQISDGVFTDSRKEGKNKIFFALRGANFNGNTYANDTLQRGALAAVVDEDIQGDNVIRVENVLETLQALARHHRRQFEIPIIGLTGSNGKTTTKELLYNVLSQRFKVHATAGNFNNHIGVPLTLLSMPMDSEIAIIEMGANHKSEIGELCQIAEPNFGLITNIGKAHLEGFGSIQGVFEGKKELFDYIENVGGVFFRNDDDPFLKNLSAERIIAYDFDEKQGISHFPLTLILEKHLVHSNLFGTYNALNIAAANSIAKYFDISLMDRIYGIESYHPKNNRSQIIKKENDSGYIILDAYNANPSSMKKSIESFAQLLGPKALILGSMKELGSSSKNEHEDLVDFIGQFDFQFLVLIGSEFESVSYVKDFKYYPSVESLSLASWKDELKACTILLKGSRSLKLERLL